MQPTVNSSQVDQAREKYFNKDRILKGDSVYSRLFFTWISCLLRLGKHCPIDTPDLPQLHPSMHPRIEFDRIEAILASARRSAKQGLTLLKVIVRSYSHSLLALGLLSLLITVFTMTAPILTHRIISYVQIPSEERSL
jgi:hypothetical protein